VSQARQYDEYRNTPLWRAVQSIVAELESSGEIKIETAPEYVIGYMCRELAAKWVVASSALGRER
jgi:hypothetical protein